MFGDLALDPASKEEENLEKPPKAWDLASTSITLGNNRVTVDNTAYAASRVDNEDHLPSFETPSVESPLLFSIPANTYPAQCMPIKRESSIDDICNVKHAKREFQYGAS